MKLKAIPVKEFRGSVLYFRSEYSGGCKITIGFSEDNSDRATEYLVLEYLPLKYTTVLCLQHFDSGDVEDSLVGCIDANEKLEEIEKWFRDGLSRVYYRDRYVKDIIDSVNLREYLEELKQCYQRFSPIIQKKEDEEVREYREIEESIWGEQE